MSLKRSIIDHIKNIGGYRTHRKIVVFLIDDYGNVRLDSKEAIDRMTKDGLKMRNRFDYYDSLETKEDIEMLIELLNSFRDKNGRPVIITPFVVPCNINFEKMEEDGWQSYHYEELSETFNKLSLYQPNAYKGTWEMWQEAINNEFFVPQFHGREHLNLKVLNEKLAARDKELLISLKNRSFAGIKDSEYSTISCTAAFDFYDFTETASFPEIISDGLIKFEKVFGKKALHYNSPGSSDHHINYEVLKKHGIKYLDNPWLKKEHQGLNKYKWSLNITGQKTTEGLIKIVRNVVFEPGVKINFDWAAYALKQVNIAFKFKKPAIISSHRVNFCGHIDPENRKKGLINLRNLISGILKIHPEVEFMSSAELGKLIESQIKNYHVYKMA